MKEKKKNNIKNGTTKIKIKDIINKNKKIIILLVCLIISGISLFLTINNVKNGINYNNSKSGISELELDLEKDLTSDTQTDEIDDNNEDDSADNFNPTTEKTYTEGYIYISDNILDELNIVKFEYNLKISLPVYYILVIIISIIFSLLFMNLIIILYNKYINKKSLNSLVKIMIVLIGTVILVLSIVCFFHYIIVEKSYMRENEKLINSLETNDIDTLENYTVDNKGIKRNTSSKVSDTHKSSIVEFKNLEIYSDPEDINKVIFEFEVLNVSSKYYDCLVFDIVFIDNLDNQYTVAAVVGVLDKGETQTVTGYTYQKIIDAKDYSFTIREIGHQDDV